MNDDELAPYEHPLVGGEQGVLSKRERQTADQLRRLDPQLAGLYEQALRFLTQINEPGIAYFVAHAGREISRGVIQRLLSDEKIQIPVDQIEQDKKNRSTIAGVLHLPPADPRVDIWFQLPRKFSAWMKYREVGPPADEVKNAFQQLSSLLFGRIGPYFSTQSELEALLRLPQPTKQDFEALQTHLLRPAQRQYFFSKLQNPLWVELLNDAGVFSNPPDLVPTIDPNKSLILPWPEGAYLARVAPLVPQLAVSVFQRIPATLKNPIVWTVVADAACELSADLAGSLVEKLTQALESGSANFFAEKVVRVTAALALEGKIEAFDLADRLLLVPSSTEGHDSVVAVYNTEWMLPRLAAPGVGAFFKSVLPALEAMDPERTLKLLLSKIDRINQFSEPDEYGLGIWRRANDSDSARENIPAQLFAAMTGVAVRLATSSSASATTVMQMLEERSGKIFTKLKYGILAKAGEYLIAKIDEIIASDEAINPPYFFREIPELIRTQFRNASPWARRFFRYGLERGPDIKQLRGYLIDEETAGQNESQISEARSQWLRRRLTWFRGEIPEELRGLEKEAGMEGSKPSFRDQELAEGESYIGGGVSWIGEPPVETEDFSGKSPEELFELLRGWTAEQTEESRRIGTKLERSVTEYSVKFPDLALEVARMIMKEAVSPRFVHSLLIGFRPTVQAEVRIDWIRALEFAAWAIEMACQQTASSPEEILNWSEVASAAVSLAKSGADDDRAPQATSESMWAIMNAATSCGLLWRDVGREPFKSFEEVLTAALNTDSGQLVEALMSVSLWVYRSSTAGGSEDEDQAQVDAETRLRHQLIPNLEQILNKEGHSGIAAQAMLGHYIPQVHLLAPEWVVTNSERLFGDGALEPLARPIWAAYITRAQSYKNVFEALRPWYLVAAQVAGTSAGRIDEKEREWSITRNLAIKVTIEMIRGNVSVGDSDALLETVFANVPVSDKSQAYWNIFSWWREPSEAPPESFIQRLVSLWEWRLSEIAEESDSADTIAEASALSWLFKTPHIPNEVLIRVGLPTIKLARGDIEVYGAWEKLLELSKIDPDAVFKALDLIVKQKLRDDYPYIPVEDVLPILRAILSTGTVETKKGATQLINRLGENGYLQFGELLDDEGE